MPQSYGQVLVVSSTTRPTGFDLYYGRTIVETDTGKLLIYYGATTGWQPPWNTSWGEIVAPTQITANQTPITATVDVTSGTITWTAVANRRYLLTAESYFFSSVANDLAVLVIADNSSTQLQSAEITCTSTSLGIKANLSAEVTGLAAGAVTYKLRAARGAGSGNITLNAAATSPTILRVMDVGSNGAPL